MFEIIGKYNTATVYAASADAESYAQVLRMCNDEALKDARIRMMPDMHAAEGCTVGTSLTVDPLGGRINPAYVGSDIGCGMQVWKLADEAGSVDPASLDTLIRTRIPGGAAIHPHAHPATRDLPLEALHCFEHIRHETVARSLGTLGGGNHFIELDADLDGALWLVIHSGSRRLGRDVAGYYQASALFCALGLDPDEAHRKHLTPGDLKTTRRAEDCFLSGTPLSHYLADMHIAVAYAERSRVLMGEAILEGLGLHPTDTFTTIHNYIDTAKGILRKGAVSAQAGERLIIPINMRDGSLVCVGRGNPDWNWTAPHGSGRVMRRSRAKETLSMTDYRAAMAGIWSSSVSEATLDESPMAYRGIDEILDTISPTAEVVSILTPVYNFKTSQPSTPDDETRDGTD